MGEEEKRKEIANITQDMISTQLKRIDAAACRLLHGYGSCRVKWSVLSFFIAIDYSK
jgi:hypothetical protein